MLLVYIVFSKIWFWVFNLISQIEKLNSIFFIKHAKIYSIFNSVILIDDILISFGLSFRFGNIDLNFFEKIFSNWDLIKLNIKCPTIYFLVGVVTVFSKYFPCLSLALLNSITLLYKSSEIVKFPLNLFIWVVVYCCLIVCKLKVFKSYCEHFIWFWC